ncbi:hypothetical protein D9619_004417 [Psilocybe cf. subviscida]|uniref:Uncharacterized protein n=1 Tax=Psilocybe cf. subviscida TaxID=2480587 RepID=A0A8H5BRA9_9AGAR|nr:hypothetical protein D9619_004417 [Psilocybe cf. subviscida]
MAPNAPPSSTRAQLPNDLYRDIVNNLHRFEERGTLLCLALVNKAWCAESQRVLFRTVCDDSWDEDKRESLIHAHTLFLNAIILNPTRLGPYVQTYKQRELILHPLLVTDSTFLFAGAMAHLWGLTAKALPALIHLKHLFITPRYDDAKSSHTSLLKGCVFMLESFRWGFTFRDPSEDGLFVKFLRIQHTLSHLEVGPLPMFQDDSWMPDDLCPGLRSTSCTLESTTRIHKREKLIGLSASLQSVPPTVLSPLCRLKYLSLLTHPECMKTSGAIDLDAVLLELPVWDLALVTSLPSLPKLRILALIRVPRDVPPSKPLYHGVMSAQEENSLRKQATIESFRRFPRLQYVVVEDIYSGRGPKRFRKLSIPGFNGGPNTTQEIQSEEFAVEYEFGKPWWTAYGV